MPATVILNPYSNRWEAGRRAPELEARLSAANIDFILQKTERPGHAIELARNAVHSGYLPLIAVGGDGAVSEVVNGLLQATPPDQYPAGPLGLIPFGTANDLTDVIGIPRDLEAAVQVIADGKTRRMDVGRVNGHFFGNNAAIGLEPMVTIENIRLTAMDTAAVPKADLGSWGSRVTLMNGNAILDACRKIKDMLIPIVFAQFDLNQIHDIAFEDGYVFAKTSPKKRLSFAECVYKALRGRRGEPLTARGYYTPRNRGLVSPAFSFGAQVAEVEVDSDTGLVTVEKIYTAHDCGVPINRKAVEGQLEGAVQMGLGYTLSEQFVMEDGRTLNTTFLDYKVPTALDMPPCESVDVETYEPEGPFGAKEAGEGLAIPTGPAIAHAVYEATGYRCRELPITPEKILRATGKIK